MNNIKDLFLNREDAENVLSEYMAQCKDKRSWEAWAYLSNIKEPQNLAKPDAYSLLAEVRARIEDDMNKLSAAGMSHKITGHIRSLKIIDEFIGEHFS